MPHRPARPTFREEPPPTPLRPPVLPPRCGLDIARASGARVVIGASGEGCCYAWRERVIVLSPEVAAGTDMGSLLRAAEEVAHYHQPRWLHRWRFLQPLRWLAEADAFLRVKAAFTGVR